MRGAFCPHVVCSTRRTENSYGKEIDERERSHRRGGHPGRLPVFLRAPVCHKSIICEPLLEKIDLTPWLTPQIEQVSVGGESGPGARLCRYEWVVSLAEQCRQAGVPFHFRQTGALFEKDGKVYQIARKFQSSQAKKAGLDYEGNTK